MDAAPALDVEALVAARIRAGLSQNELARAMGLSSGQRMSRWERGDARPRNPQMLHALAAALGVAPRELLVPMETPDLRWLRFVAGLSVEELAEAAHVSVSTLKRWEARGLRDPSPAIVSTLSRLLYVNANNVVDALTR